MKDLNEENRYKNIIKAMIEFHVQAGGGVAMDADNPFFKSRYATLGQIINVINAIAPALGLTWVQFPVSAEAQIGVKTVIMHESGEILEDQVMVPFTQEIIRLNKKDEPFTITRNAAQEAGSVITYLRRYGLAAAFGLYADEDLDGNTPDQVKAAPAIARPSIFKTPTPQPVETPIDPDFPEAGTYVAPEVAATSPKVSAQPRTASARPSSASSPVSLKTTPAIVKAEHIRKLQAHVAHEGDQYGYQLREALDAMGYTKAASEAQIRFLERLMVDLIPDADIRHEVRWDVLRVNDFKSDPGLSHPRIAAFMKWINPTPITTGEKTSTGKDKIIYTFPQDVLDSIDMAIAPYLGDPE